MAVKVRVEPIDRQISLIVDQMLSPDAQSKYFAAFARQKIDEATQINKRILGREPRKTVYVDGKEGAPLESVKPNGVVIAEFHVVLDLLSWIHRQLQLHSPVLTGRYRSSHVAFADGMEVSPEGRIPMAEEYIIVNTQPYARKIERGLSSQAPDGVYQAVATLAASRFRGVARVSFTYTSIFGGERNPAVLVRVGNA